VAGSQFKELYLCLVSIEMKFQSVVLEYSYMNKYCVTKHLHFLVKESVVLTCLTFGLPTVKKIQLH